MTTRRQFIRLSAGAAAGATLLGGTYACASPEAATEAIQPLKILVLGGTSFLGPAQVDYMLTRGHEVTLFNRGRTNPGLYPDLEKLVGDRATGDLEALAGRTWDAVLDNSATVPRWAKESTELLQNATDTYLYVSSVSVYSDNSIVGLDESDPVYQLDDPNIEQMRSGEDYGGMKALCEEYTRQAFGDGAIVVRPGLIVGPGDGTDRYTYWPLRVRRGGEVLAPGDPTDPVQFIDVRDLGEFMVRLVEQRAGGTYNATGPLDRPMEIQEMLSDIAAVTANNPEFTWVPADFLDEQGIRPWQDMPVWIPPSPGMEGFSQADCSRAIAAGMTFRPHAETVRATLDWADTWDEERKARPLGFGITAEREAGVLAAWHSSLERTS